MNAAAPSESPAGPFYIVLRFRRLFAILQRVRVLHRPASGNGSSKNLENVKNFAEWAVIIGRHYTLTSIRKFISKYVGMLHTPYVIHGQDLKTADGIVYLPYYMTPCL